MLSPKVVLGKAEVLFSFLIGISVCVPDVLDIFDL
jgi:hypothetical protein